MVLMVGIANALDLGEIHNPLPSIKIIYPEPVTITGFSLLNSSGDNKLIIPDPIFNDPSNKSFKYQVTELLIEDDYLFGVTARDEHGNSNLSEYTFNIRILPLSITLFEPALSYSPISPSTVTFRTERAVECRYYVDLDVVFDSSTDFDFTNTLYHNITAYDFNILTLPPDKKRTFYVKCNDTYRAGEISSNSFDLYLDNTKPIIQQKSANPDLVIESPYETTLSVTTDEETLCRYGTSTIYENMTLFSSVYDTTHNITIIAPSTPQTYTYYLNCENKAGLKSDNMGTDNLIITVNPNVGLSLAIDTPSISSDTSIIFELTTNKVAECFYSTNSDFSGSFKFAATNSKKHLNPAVTLSPGEHDYYFKCLKPSESATNSLHLIIDTTPPTMLFVNDSGPLADDPFKTYYTDRLKANWLAEDNETGIASYEYSIYLYKPNGNILLLNETTSDTQVLADNLELNNSKKYLFSVRAMNPVGLWSTSKSSKGLIVDNTTRPATCDDLEKNGDETDTDCGGSCPNCGKDKSCDLNKDCLTGYCNIYSVCAIPSCTDEDENGNETDTDCGGGCPPCGTDNTCKIDSDCLSGECLATKCTRPDTCKNNKIDEGETDFDCGGPCEKCNHGKQCQSNSDCTDNFCKGGVCVKATCDDEELNQDETDTDCGGSSCPGCEISYTCLIDSDCKSENCEAGICSEPLDADGDGLPNEWENRYNLDPENEDSNGNGVLDPDEDLDDDGLTNLEEWQSGYAIDPRNSDTDGDGYSDKEEIDEGTDPTDPESHPGTNYLLIILLTTIILAVLGGGGYYGYKYKTQIISWVNKIMPSKKAAPKGTPSAIPRPGGVHPRGPAPRKPVTPLRKPIIRPKTLTKTALQKKEEQKKKREKLFESFSSKGIDTAKPSKSTKKPSADDFDIKPIKLKSLKKRKRTYLRHKPMAIKPITSIGKTPSHPSQAAKKPVTPLKSAQPPSIMDQLKNLVSKPEEKAGPLGKIRNPLKTSKPTLAKPSSAKSAPISKINAFDKLMGFSKHDLKKPEVKQHLSNHLSKTLGKEIKEDTFNKLTNLVKSDKVERKDIFNTIKHLSKRGHKEFTKTASKHMLSHLINTKKSNKAHVTDVLHSLKDKKVFSEDDVFDILGHIEKHEQKK